MDNLKEAEYLVVINNPPDLPFPSEKILYYKTEPEEFYYVPHYWNRPWIDKTKSRFYPMDETHPRIQTWDVSKDYDYFWEHMKGFPKKWMMQVVTTNYGDGTQTEQQLTGHINRMRFLQKFLDHYGDQTNVWRLWGRRLTEYRYPVNYGEILDKFDALWNSEYTFAFMNSNQPGFFDEKITDAILCDCMPIVYGCPNLEKILPKNSFIRLDITKEEAVREAWDIIHSDHYDVNHDALVEAKRVILSELSVCPRLYKDIGE